MRGVASWTNPLRLRHCSVAHSHSVRGTMSVKMTQSSLSGKPPSYLNRSFLSLGYASCRWRLHFSKLFLFFLRGLAFNAMGGDGSSFQSLEINGFAAHLTETESPIFDLLERLSDLIDQLSFSIAYPELEIPVRPPWTLDRLGPETMSYLPTQSCHRPFCRLLGPVHPIASEVSLGSTQGLLF